MAKYLILLSAIGLLFALPGNAQETEREKPNDSFYQRRSVEERKPIELPFVREADVLWSKRIWQNIDVRMKINQPLYFPETPKGGYRSLMQLLMDSIESGAIRAYSVDDDSFEGEPLDPEQLFRELGRTEDFIPEGETTPQTVVIDFNPNEVFIFRIKEEWFVDARRGVMDVRIIGLAPARLVRDEETGEFRDVFETLFWIPFEDARESLASAPVYNRQNDAQRISFDDFFIRRFFSATVYREQRPDGRVISEYFDDQLDQLLEADRIGEEIRNFEIDLWHY
ncbi:MAG: gliding motility protein GldN [Bacteroidales bacterium]